MRHPIDTYYLSQKKQLGSASRLLMIKIAYYKPLIKMHLRSSAVNFRSFAVIYGRLRFIITIARSILKKILRRYYSGTIFVLFQYFFSNTARNFAWTSLSDYIPYIKLGINCFIPCDLALGLSLP